MTSASFARMATVTASTKRNPAQVAGKTGAASAYLAGLKILPLMPVSKEIEERYQLKSPRLSYVTYIQGAPDIVNGDVLRVATVDYKVIGAPPWPTDNSFLELVVEKVIGG
jgi:hypothetical protein